MTEMKPSCYNHYLQRGSNWFVMNCRTQAVLELSGATHMAISNNGCSSIAAGELALLQEHGIVISAEVNEKNLVIDLNRSMRLQPSLAGVCIVPTMACNLSCNYCYQGVKLSNSEQTIALDTLKKGLTHHLAQLCGRYPSVKKLEVNWYGGEPLLCKDRVFDLSAWFKNHAADLGMSLELSMITNGYLLNPSTVEKLARLNWSWVQLTLDGAREVHNRRRRHRVSGGTFDHLLDRITCFKNFPDIKVSLRVNVDQENAPTMAEMLEQLANAGLVDLKNLALYFAPVRPSTLVCLMDTMCVIPASDFGSLESELLRMAAAAGFRTMVKPRSRIAGCSANGPAVIVVDPQGKVHKCVGSLGDQVLEVGVLTEEGLQITNATMNNAWLNWSPSERCRSCNVLPLCMGGCSMQDVLGTTSSDSTSLQIMGEERCTPWRHRMDKLLATYVDKLLLTIHKEAGQ